jgi:hypothetical protein
MTGSSPRLARPVTPLPRKGQTTIQAAWKRDAPGSASRSPWKPDPKRQRLLAVPVDDKCTRMLAEGILIVDPDPTPAESINGPGSPRPPPTIVVNLPKSPVVNLLTARKPRVGCRILSTDGRKCIGKSTQASQQTVQSTGSAT